MPIDSAAELQAAIHTPLPFRLDIGIGCVGAGFIMADCHLVAYRQHGLNPVAITSRTAARARQVAERHQISSVYANVEELVADSRVEVLDVAVPPDCQARVIKTALAANHHLKAILAQKPLGMNYAEAVEIVELCEDAGVTLAVNQNMRFDHSVRACGRLLESQTLGKPILATIDMRAIPHWMPWQQRLGWVTLRIMSIHHLDTFRYWLGDPHRVFCSVRPDPRTAKKFDHSDGIAMYILEFPDGTRASSWDDVWTGPAREGSAGDIGIKWRVEGMDGLATGTIGWPGYPHRVPSTLKYSTTRDNGQWHEPMWDAVWFPDAFIGPMAELLTSLETGNIPSINGRDNLKTMALVEACYRSAERHQSVEIAEITNEPVASN